MTVIDWLGAWGILSLGFIGGFILGAALHARGDAE